MYGASPRDPEVLTERDEPKNPRWTTVQAFDDFVRGRALRLVIDSKLVAGVECALVAARLR